MYSIDKLDDNLSVEDQYTMLCRQLTHLVEGERDAIANMANAAALLYHQLPRLNWAGFYRIVEADRSLVLGPFHGLPACIRIPFGRGVCGTAVKLETTLVVEDVNQFPGHIACDAASQSEIVVPLVHAGRVVGVLDMDSPVVSRFTEADRRGLEPFVRILVEGSDWD